MRNKKLLLYLICTEAMLILCIVLANLNPVPVLYFFYNFLYGLVFSLLVPLYCLWREKESLASVGVKRLGPRQFTVMSVSSTIAAIITLVLIGFIIADFSNRVAALYSLAYAI